jgi:hypothetical protein
MAGAAHVTLRGVLLGTSLAATLAACHEKQQRFDTNVEVVSIRTMGSTKSLVEMKLDFVDCPGDVRRIVRGDKELAACAGNFKKGEKLPATLHFFYDAERENYRADLVKLGSCDVKLDPKEEANYESVQVCRDLQSSGVTVGVHCDKKREGELIAKCPWLKRR